ncbi:MAG: hypothetical protein EXR79_14565 [Myxococcales bacterium]|nr:hypothetical protein [Myxococcales bacterium]
MPSRSVRRRRFLPWLALGLALGSVATACSDDPAPTSSTSNLTFALGLKPGQVDTLTSVETTIDPAKIAAGGEATVTCTGQPGNILIPKPTYAVKAAFATKANPDIKPNGAKLTVRTVGNFEVACTVGTKLSDATPALLNVTAGPAASLSAKVTPAQIAAGDVASVTCAGQDAFGNDVGAIAGWTVTLAPPEHGEAKDLTIEGRKVGKADVKCSRADAPDAPSTAATLTVVPGKPARTLASVAPASIQAGEAGADVACTAEDAHGNAVAVDPAKFTVDPPPGLTLTGKKLRSEKTGKYEVKCGLDGTAEQKPAALEVTPGKPISMTLYAKPKAPVYKEDDTVQIFGLGKDKFGNDVPEMILEKPIAVGPPEGVTVNGTGGSFSFSWDGKYTFAGKSKDVPELKGSITLLCDSKGPLVNITAPKRGETRQGDAKVVIKGTLLDEWSAIKSFAINGTPIKWGKDGAFSLDNQSVQGMNPIVWEAKDEWDNVSTGVQTYYYSTKWYQTDIAKPTAGAVKDGIGFWMAQQTIDAGPPHNHQKPKDLASVFEMVLGTLDFGSLLGGGGGGVPINQAGVFQGTLAPKDIKMGDKAKNGGYPEVSLQVVQNGLHMGIKIYKFAMTLVIDGKAGIAPIQIPVTGQEVYVKAEMVTVDTDVQITIDPKTGQPKSEAKNTKVTLKDLKVELPGIAGQLLNWLTNAIVGVLTPLIEGVMQDQIQKQIGSVLGDTLGKLAINQDLPLKPFIGEGAEVKLKLNSKIGQIKFVPPASGSPGMLIGLDGSVTSEKKVDVTTLGSIGRASCLGPTGKEVFNPGLKFALEVGLHDDFANELLNAVWNGGLMTLSISEKQLGSVDLAKYGVKDLSISTRFLLPPILNTCVDVGKGTLKLQIGDLELHAKLDFAGTPIDLWLFAMMQATAELKAVDNPKTGQKELGFALKSIDVVELEIAKINAEAKGLKDLFVTMIKTVMLPKLVESLGAGLGSFPLPAFDLGAFAPCDPKNPGKTCIPAGTELAVDIQQIDNKDGYTYLRGKVK